MDETLNVGATESVEATPVVETPAEVVAETPVVEAVEPVVAAEEVVADVTAYDEVLPSQTAPTE